MDGRMEKISHPLIDPLQQSLMTYTIFWVLEKEEAKCTNEKKKKKVTK